MDFKEKLLELLGDDNSDKVEAINKAIPEFYVPKAKYNDMSTRAKTAESRISELDGEIENTKNSLLTDQQKNQKIIDDAVKAKSEYAKKFNKLEAEKILVNAGLKEEDYNEFIDGIVSENLESTTKYATSFANTLSKTKETLEKSINDKLLQNTPRPDAGSNPLPNVLTKETFDNMSYSEQMAISKTNPTKYQEFTSQQ